MESPDNGWTEHKMFVQESLKRLTKVQDKQGEMITEIRMDVAEMKTRRSGLKAILHFVGGLFS